MSHLRQGGSRHGRSAAWWLGAGIFCIMLMLFAPDSVRAATGDIGYQDGSTSGTSTPTGTKRAESVLWWNDGSWWANMWSSSARQFRIFRLDTSTQAWTDTGVTVDPRANTHSDVLWDGAHVYVASHLFVADGSSAVSGSPSYLYRFSYDSAMKRYSLDTGFPVQINNYKTETLVIDKDSTGKLWATWQQQNQIYVNRTVGGDDHTWGTPFALPATGSAVTVDDNSSVIAFGGDKIGILWGNQSSTNNAMFFAVHHDGQPDTTWDASRTAIQGSGTADDHMNLKSLQADSSGRVYAAIKTSFTSSAQPLIMLLVREPTTGDWSSYTIARVSDCPNRPLVLVDEESRVLHAFYTAPGPPGYACNSSGGAIYRKTSPLDAPAFALGSGTAVIQDADSPYMHNASSTKQNVNSTTGIVVLAANGPTALYWHMYQAIAPAGGTATPPAADFSGTPTTGSAPLAVTFTDLSTGSPTSWSWNFGDGGTSTSRSPSHTYAAAGTYTVSLTATNAAGSNTMTRAGYVTVSPPAPPVADFSGTPTSGAIPLAVSFIDQSTGSPTSWSWSFGDGGSSTSQNPTHTYTTTGTYTVSLTATNAGGSNTMTRVNYITATPPPPDFTLSVSPSSRTVVRGSSTSYTVTVTATNGFSGSVDLSVSGFPAGAAGTFSVNPVVVPPTGTSTLTVTTTPTTKQGSYTLRIKGVSGALTHTVTVTLQIKRQ